VNLTSPRDDPVCQQCFEAGYRSNRAPGASLEEQACTAFFARQETDALTQINPVSPMSPGDFFDSRA
jgi:hypothetical protein